MEPDLKFTVYTDEEMKRMEFLINEIDGMIVRVKGSGAEFDAYMDEMKELVKYGGETLQHFMDSVENEMDKQESPEKTEEVNAQ
jgi:hypothetical protein